MSYGIAYLDMYDYGASWNGPKFTTAVEALAHAKRVLDADLRQAFKPGMTAKKLYDHWMMFGEDVVIAAMDGAPDLNFSGQEYARRRCEELCSAQQ